MTPKVKRNIKLFLYPLVLIRRYFLKHYMLYLQKHDLKRLAGLIYDIEGKVYFGEMTFTPKGGYCSTLTDEESLRIGKKIILPSLQK